MATAKTKLAAAVVIGALVLSGGVAGTMQTVRYFSKPAGRAVVLTNSGSIKGIVRDPNGNPLANVRVYVATDQNGANVYGPAQRGAQWSVTGADGAYEALRPDAIFELLVREPQGYAEVSGKMLERRAKGDIQLQPWGRVEGRIVTGT